MSKTFKIIIAVVLVFLVISAFLFDPAAGIAALIVAMSLGILLFKGPVRAVLFVLTSILVLTLVLFALFSAVAQIMITPEKRDQDSFYVIVAIVSMTISTGIVSFGIFMLLYVASEWVLGMSQYLGMKRFEAMRLLASRLAGLQLPYQIVADGKIITASEGTGGWLSSIGGPGLLIIKPANAAVLEWGGETSNIVGPGIMTMRQFEKAVTLIDLKPQQGTVKNQGIPTSDGVEIHITAEYSYRIKDKTASHDLIEGFRDGALPTIFEGDLPRQNDYEQDAVGRAAYRAPGGDWKEATQRVVTAALHDEIGNNSLQQIFGLPNAPFGAINGVWRSLAEEARRVAWIRAGEWGVVIDSLDILDIRVPDNVRLRVLTKWDAESDFDIVKRRGQAEAAVIRDLEGIKLNVTERHLQVFQNVFIGLASTIGNNEEQLSVYMSLLERLAHEISQDRTAAYRYFHTLEAMSRNPNANVIVSSGNPDIIIDGTLPRNV